MTRVRLAVAAVTATASATALYAVIRVVQAILFPDPDPALILWSPHAGFFWRAWTAAYVGVMLGFVAWVASARSPAWTARAASALLAGATLAIAAQGLLVP